MYGTSATCSYPYCWALTLLVDGWKNQSHHWFDRCTINQAIIKCQRGLKGRFHRWSVRKFRTVPSQNSQSTQRRYIWSYFPLRDWVWSLGGGCYIYTYRKPQHAEHPSSGALARTLAPEGQTAHTHCKTMAFIMKRACSFFTRCFHSSKRKRGGQSALSFRKIESGNTRRKSKGTTIKSRL